MSRGERRRGRGGARVGSYGAERSSESGGDNAPAAAPEVPGPKMGAGCRNRVVKASGREGLRTGIREGDPQGLSGQVPFQVSGKARPGSAGGRGAVRPTGGKRGGRARESFPKK
jgi:hypothetical protein